MWCGTSERVPVSPLIHLLPDQDKIVSVLILVFMYALEPPLTSLSYSDIQVL